MNAAVLQPSVSRAPVLIAREPFDQIYPDVQGLLQAHWREVALYQDQVALEPDVECYRAMDAAGGLVCIGARVDGRAVGYAAWFLVNHPHYRGCRVASNDVIYVAPEYRSGASVGLRLIRESELVLTSGLGVHRLTWHVKPSNDWSQILYRMGYEQEEIIMGKYIGE